MIAPLAVAQYGVAPATDGESIDGAGIPNVGVQQLLGAKVPMNAAFRDHLNQPVVLRNLFEKGKPVVLNLGYYECPMLCSEVQNSMLTAFEDVDFNIGEDFSVISITVDPKETASLAANKKERTIKAYGRDRDTANAGWHFLVGDGEASKSVADAVGFGYTFLPDVQEYAHGSAIMILTPEGTVSQYFFGLNYSPEDLRLALVEASNGGIGTMADYIKLSCFVYNSVAGTYSASVMKIIRWVAVATVLAIGLSVSLMYLRDRRRKAAFSAGTLIAHS
jgi:protein SCO1/2